MGLVVGFGSKNVRNYDPTTLLVLAVWGLACRVVGPPCGAGSLGWNGWAALLLAGGRLLAAGGGATPPPPVVLPAEAHPPIYKGTASFFSHREVLIE